MKRLLIALVLLICLSGCQKKVGTNQVLKQVVAAHQHIQDYNTNYSSQEDVGSDLEHLTMAFSIVAEAVSFKDGSGYGSRIDKKEGSLLTKTRVVSQPPKAYQQIDQQPFQEMLTPEVAIRRVLVFPYADAIDLLDQIKEQVTTESKGRYYEITYQGKDDAVIRLMADTINTFVYDQAKVSLTAKVERKSKRITALNFTLTSIENKQVYHHKQVDITYRYFNHSVPQTLSDFIDSK